MKVLQKIRFIDPVILTILDKTFLLLSFIYIYFYFQGESAIASSFTLFIFIISISNYLSKIKKNVVFSAIGYGFLAFTLLLNLFESGAYFKIMFFVPLIIFFIIIFKNYSSSFLSGILLGYWILFFYLIFSRKEVNIQSFVGAFSNAHHQEIMRNIPFIFIVGFILSLFSKSNTYVPTSNPVKVALTLLLLSIPFVGIAIFNSYSFEEVKTSVFYLIITSIIYRSLTRENIMLSSLAYSIITFIVCYIIKESYGINSFYFLLIIPLIALLLVNYFKVSVHFLIGNLFAFWITQYFYIYKNIDIGIKESLFLVFSSDGIKNSLSYCWLFLIFGILWTHKSKVIGFFIRILEKVNQQKKLKYSENFSTITSGESTKPIHKPEQKSNSWEEL